MPLTTSNYKLDRSTLECALKRSNEAEINACHTCNPQADTIKRTLGIWFYCTQLQEVVRSRNLTSKITTDNLEHNGCNFVDSLSKLHPGATQQPIILSYNDRLKSPVIALRVVDFLHNNRVKLEHTTASYTFVYLVKEPLYGDLEPCMIEYKHVPSKKYPELNKLTKKFTYNIDGGVKITQYLVNLLSGKINGQIVI